jgi:hypothetical protein
LTSDTEFLTLLASALNSLATLQLAQKRQFTESVQMLAREVSAVSSPSRPKSDLYIWREIFALWIEAEIFESSRERDRGERSIEEVEKHLVRRPGRQAQTRQADEAQGEPGRAREVYRPQRRIARPQKVPDRKRGSGAQDRGSKDLLFSLF